MKPAPLSCFCRWLAVAFLMSLCLWQSVKTASPCVDLKGAYSYLFAWRSAAREAPQGKVGLLCNDADSISPIERSRMVAIAWERTSMPPVAVDKASDFDAVDCILSSAWVSRIAEARLKECGFSLLSKNEYVKTWHRQGWSAVAHQDKASEVSRAREIFALILEFAATVLFLAIVLGRRGIGGCPLVASIAVATFLAFVALSHPLLAPNGLGVYGGKAKLLFECGGVPDGFWASTQYAVLQPSYPPGLTALAYLHFALSGGCGDRLVQMLAVFAMLSLCISLLQKSNRAADALPVVPYCLSPVAVRMSAGFYAEPFAALMLVVGWIMLRRGKSLRGAAVMGLAGLFRLEAAFVAIAFAAGHCMLRGGFGEKLRVLLLAALPGFAWHIVCKALGCGGPSDWNFASMPDIGNIAYASWVEVKSLSLHVIPVAALALLVRPLRVLRAGPTLAISLVPALLVFLALPLACGFYSSPYSHWMIDNTIPRVVWYASAIPLLGLVASRRCATVDIYGGEGV